MSTTAIDPQTRVGLLSLTVADLDRSIDFYTNAFGLALLQGSAGRAILGAGGIPLLLLTEKPGARSFPHDQFGYTGLYHFAILVPSRADLGLWLAHWLQTGHSLPGMGDHLVSEALYITDPDGNNIEIYRDRPRDSWTWTFGKVAMATDPVDIRGLLAEAGGESELWRGLPAGTRLGHMHLQVGDIKLAAEFYHEVLGFDVTAEMPTALFVSAGGYHHHLGLNTWHSKGAGPTPADVAGLRFFTIDFVDEAARRAVLSRLDAANVPYRAADRAVIVEDPWHTAIVLQVGAVSDWPAAAELEAMSATA